MLNEITADTPISELLQMSEVNGIINELTSSVESYTNIIGSSIETEMSLGCLSKNAFSLNGDYQLNDKGNVALNNIEDITSTVSSIKSSVLSKATAQRKAEIEKLKSELEKKISELTLELSSAKIQLQAKSKIITTPPHEIQGLSNKVNYLETNLKKYKDKLEIVNGLS